MSIADIKINYKIDPHIIDSLRYSLATAKAIIDYEEHLLSVKEYLKMNYCSSISAFLFWSIEKKLPLTKHQPFSRIDMLELIEKWLSTGTYNADYVFKFLTGIRGM